MNKPITVTEFRITVSKNSLCKAGYCPTLRMSAIFPNQRKPRPQIASRTCMAGYVWVTPLYGHNGRANISPSDWRKLAQAAKVESDDLSPVTDELAQAMRDREASWADSAEKQLADDQFVCEAWRNSVHETWNPVEIA